MFFLPQTSSDNLTVAMGCNPTADYHQAIVDLQLLKCGSLKLYMRHVCARLDMGGSKYLHLGGILLSVLAASSAKRLIVTGGNTPYKKLRSLVY